MLWVGIQGDLTPLVSLHKDIEEALEGLGFARDGRDFSPHLTVGRLREGASREERQRAAEALSSARIGPGLRIPVNSLSLMQSLLHPDGAVYECLVSMPLKGGYRN